jgi:hypothetical protein
MKITAIDPIAEIRSQAGKEDHGETQIFKIYEPK